MSLSWLSKRLFLARSIYRPLENASDDRDSCVTCCLDLNFRVRAKTNYDFTRPWGQIRDYRVRTEHQETFLPGF